ncbi:MAG: four helix bundle protein [Burkholderiales bacterium]
MAAQRPHEKLNVWRESMALAEQVYRICGDLPETEKYGLISQMQRAAVSIPSNIAEGAVRGSRKEYIQFLTIARGSLSELDTQLQLSLKIGLIGDVSDIRLKVDQVFGLLNGLLKSLRQTQ